MTHRMRPTPWHFSLIAAGIAAAIAGCAGQATERFTPPAETAGDCLQAALAAWRDGVSAEILASRQPAIRVIDTVRSPDRRLREFEVLSTSRASAAGWNYVVRLTYEAPAATERARFVVVGVDPILVFRKEDYDHLAHWEHAMPEASPTASDRQDDEP